MKRIVLIFSCVVSMNSMANTEPLNAVSAQPLFLQKTIAGCIAIGIDKVVLQNFFLVHHFAQQCAEQHEAQLQAEEHGDELPARSKTAIAGKVATSAASYSLAYGFASALEKIPAPDSAYSNFGRNCTCGALSGGAISLTEELILRRYETTNKLIQTHWWQQGGRCVVQFLGATLCAIAARNYL